DVVCRLTGLDAQLALQRIGASMVHTQRASAIAAEGQQLHQATVTRFIQRVIADHTPPTGDRLGYLSLALQQLDKLAERLQILLSYALTRRCDPLIVAARQEVGGIDADRSFERLQPQTRLLLMCRGLRQGALKLGDIQAKWRVGAPVERVGVRKEERL